MRRMTMKLLNKLQKALKQHEKQKKVD